MTPKYHWVHPWRAPSTTRVFDPLDPHIAGLRQPHILGLEHGTLVWMAKNHQESLGPPEYFLGAAPQIHTYTLETGMCKVTTV